MPSSSASLARYGGASDVNVAARRVATASDVRSLYGAVRRASVEMRRAVRRQDQSATSAPRCIVRWLPGCQTLTAASLELRARGWETHLPNPTARAYRRNPRAWRADRAETVPSRGCLQP